MVSVPSFVTPMRPRVISMWRRFTAAMHSWLVNSILTGLRTFLARRAVTIMKLLLHHSPNEQPEGRATTRTLLIGIPKA